jgi:hypothetical protein
VNRSINEIDNRVNAEEETKDTRVARLPDKQNASDEKRKRDAAEADITTESKHSNAPGTQQKKAKNDENDIEAPAEQQSRRAKSVSAASNREQTANTANKEPENSNAVLPVRALVSSLAQLSTDMMVTDVLLAGAIAIAHLDTCATHCFLSGNISKKLAKRGYPPLVSKVNYNVEQGQPLCSTSKVHVIPLAISRNNGSQATWEAILFVVADCGADVIIGYPTLRMGGIVDYNPPENHAALLQAISYSSLPQPTELQEAARHILGRRGAYKYGPPSNGKTVAFSLEDPLKDLNLGVSKSMRTELQQNPVQVKSKPKFAPIAALTEAEPYGKNPVLPEEVLEALTLLKNLAEDNAPAYTATQIREVEERLKANRPQWAKCLTMQHLEEISDKETEGILNQMMDKPRWQTSIFQTAMHIDTTCDFKEFEIEQKPGRDMWNPPQPKLYRSPSAKSITEEWLDGLLNNKKCRESNATHPAPVTIVEKPPRDPRVCINYINRNHRSEIPIYPMPDVWDFLEEAAGFDHYCSFDMAKMFTQFRIKEAHKHLAAFITPRGVYEPNVVMFGLAGAPQHAVREVGGGMAKDPRTNGIKFTEWALDQNAKGVTPPYELCPITKVVKGSRLRPFIDDVFIRSNHTAGMVKLVELFFEFCEAHNLILSRKKANLMKKCLKTLGFVVSKEGKHLDPSRIISLLEMTLPRSKETLHSMLSSFTFVRMFIPNFALIAAPLYEATKGIVWKGPHSGKAQGIKIIDPDFEWTEQMMRAYDQLKSALLEAPILVSPDWNLPLFLSVDASMRGEGWVLWQLIATSDGIKVAVAILYGSRKYSDTERKWETTRQEATAIRSALEDVQEYVFGQHFYLFSDHLNLRFMHNSINRAVLRMRDFLAQFNMTVVHCPGAWNNADSISRLEIDKLPTEEASNLNSATEGIIRDEGIQSFSIGTCTSLDFPQDDDMAVLVTNKHMNDTTQVHILKTVAQCDMCPCHNTCLLCNLDGEIDETHSETSDTTDESVEVLKTNASEPRASAWEGDGLEPVIHQILTNLGCDIALCEAHIESALKWNSHKCDYPSEIDLPIQRDILDEEEIGWCETIDRSTVEAVTVETKCCLAKTRSQSQRENSLDTLAEESQSQPTTEPTPSQPTRDVFLGCKTRRPTQTTPADFRMAAIPIPMIEDFRAIHNDTSGHHGLDFSYRKLLKRCGSKWANERGQATKIKEQLKIFLDGCPTCQKLRGLRDRIKCKHSFIVSRPFLEISYDFIVFKRPDKNGNRYLLVAIDNFGKLVEMKPVEHRDAETVAKFLLEIQSRYGSCARLRSDREGAFVGQIITKLNENRGTEPTPCIPYRPEANSICERQNAIIMFHLMALVLGCNLGKKDKVAWSDLVPMVFSIVNNTPKNPLGISPLSLVYGVFANYDRPLLNPITANAEGAVSNPVDYVDALIAWQTKLLELTEDIQSQHFQKLDKKLNSKQNHRTFNVGDFVLQQKDATHISGKPSCRWIGPFLVTDRRENDPSHPVLDLMNLTDMTVKEAAADDCRQFNTSWFEEDTMLPELTKIAAADLDEYVVEKILSHRPEGETRTQPLSKYFFLVQWEDFDEPTWEPYSGVRNLEPMDSYSDQHPNLKIPISSSS